MVGTLVHRFFEVLLDEHGNPEPEWRVVGGEWASSERPTDARSIALLVVELIENFLAGELRERWRTHTLVGREVPIVLEHTGPASQVLTGSMASTP